MIMPREKKILQLLYNANSNFTSKDLANLLGISSRTIKADIKCLRDELKNSGCSIETKTGKGIWLEYDEEGEKYLKHLLFEDEPVSASALDFRKYYIGLQLIDADDYISMESIADSMYISKGTVVNDINLLEPFFSKRNLKIDRKVKYGIKLIGNEKDIRLTKVNIIHKIVAYQGINITNKLQPFFEDVNLKILDNILQTTEEKYEFVLSDASYMDLLVHMSVIIKRIQKGKRVSPTNLELLEFSGKEEWKIAEFLASMIQEHHKIVLGNGDVAYLALNLIGARLQQIDTTLDFTDINSLRENAPQTLNAWERIISKVDDMYGEHLSNDITFKNGLFIHLNAMFNRLRNRIHLDNPLKETIKKDLGYEFEVATYMAGLFYAMNNIEFGEDEICDIALYIGASLEREKAKRKIINPKIIVVCGTGMGTSQFVEAKLELMFPEIKIEKILPVSRVKNYLETNTVDYIISTVPLTLETESVINVSPLLNESDIRHIEKLLSPTKSLNTYTDSAKYNSLFDLINQEIVILKANCASREEAVIMLGEKLQSKGYVDSDFIESVFNREEFAPTSIGNLFAIPHCFAGHVLKQGIALMTLSRPIQWGNEKVQIILMLAVDVKSKDSFKEIFTELSNITKDSDMINTILNADSYLDIINSL